MWKLDPNFFKCPECGATLVNLTTEEGQVAITVGKMVLVLDDVTFKKITGFIVHETECPPQVKRALEKKQGKTFVR